MFSAVWSFISSKIPLKVWLAIFSVLIALGAFFWFKHSIYQECKSDEQAKLDSQKIVELNNKIEQYKQVKISREKTDDKIRKMSSSDIDDGLVYGGWLRD